MNKKLLAVLGSSRRGNSAALLDAFCAGAGGAGLAATRLDVRDLSFSRCLACGGCDPTGECVLTDDMGMVYQAFHEHPLVVVAAPVYFASLPGQMKNLIDRFQCAWVAKYRLQRPWFSRETGRRGYLLSVSALHRPDFYDHSRAPFQALLLTLNYSDAGGTYFPGHDEEDAVRADARALELSRQAGERFARESTSVQA